MITVKEKKSKVIDEIKEKSNVSKSIVFLNFSGETVVKTTKLKKELSKKDSSYKVAKKTLIKKALIDSGISGDYPDFKGELALVFSETENISDVLKFLSGLAKEGKFKVMGGVFENEFKDAVFMAALSKLPLKETIYYQLVNTLNAPLKQTVDVLEGGITNFIRVLDQIAKK